MPGTRGSGGSGVPLDISGAIPKFPHTKIFPLMNPRPAPPWLSVTSRVIFAAWLGGLCLLLNAAEEGVRPPAASAVVTSTNSPFQRAGPSLLELGQVRLDQKTRIITFPATVNQRDVNVEYLVVTREGKTHESILRTDAEAMHLQLALLLIDAKGAGTNALPEAPSASLPGEKLVLEVTWKTGATTNTVRAEELVLDLKSAAPAARGPWIYTGSRMREGALAAQADGSIVSLITDPDALINNPRPGREDDDRWKPNAAVLPPLNATVEVSIRVIR